MTTITRNMKASNSDNVGRFSPRQINSKFVRRRPGERHSRGSNSSPACRKLTIRRKSKAPMAFGAAAPLLLLLVHLIISTTQACQPVHFGPDINGDQKVACRCNESYCDSELKFDWPENDSSIFRLTSSLRGARFEPSTLKLEDLQVSAEGAQQEADFSVRVDINKRFQQVVGYGGAFTDSASMLMMDKLTPASRAHLLADYFGPTGLDYNLARVPIGGTDMSWRAYSYNDMPGGQEDFELNGFELQDEDMSYKLPLIKQVNELRRNASREPLKLLASSWSAPNWMKSNRNLVQGRLKDDDMQDQDDDDDLDGLPSTIIKGKYYDAYARYICKFMDQYEEQLTAAAGGAGHEFRMWALTPQNEPCTPGRLGYSVVNYNSVNFDPDQMAQFISSHLVPNLLRGNRTTRDLALFIWDDTLLGFDKYKDHLFGGGGGGDGKQVAPAADYIRGLALHWYSQGLDKLPYSVLYDLRRWLPPKFSMISTEASFIGRPIAGDWTRGEKYARDIIENFRSGSVGWIDWNLALNLEGGPTWSKNFLDAAVLIDERTGSYLKSPMFYAVGHLSRFVQPQSYIVDSQVRARDSTPGNSSSKADVASPERAVWRLVDEAGEQTSQLLVVASELYFDGKQRGGRAAGPSSRQIALVLLNRAPSDVRVSLELADCRSRLGRTKLPLSLRLEAKSFTSLAFNC